MTTPAPYIYTPEAVCAARDCYEILRPWLENSETLAGELQGDLERANGDLSNVERQPSFAGNTSNRNSEY